MLQGVPPKLTILMGHPVYICGLQNVFGSASLRVEAITHATLGCFLVSSIIGGYVNHVPSGQSKVSKQIFVNYNQGKPEKGSTVKCTNLVLCL